MLENKYFVCLVARLLGRQVSGRLKNNLSISYAVTCPDKFGSVTQNYSDVGLLSNLLMIQLVLTCSKCIELVAFLTRRQPQDLEWEQMSSSQGLESEWRYFEDERRNGFIGLCK